MTPIIGQEPCRPQARPRPVARRVLAPCVGAGPWLEGAHGLPCKWLEALGAAEPPLWDVLQVAHGPFQQFLDEEMTLVTLEHDGFPEEQAIFDRLVAMVAAPRHAVVRLRAGLPPPFGAIDHDVLTTALLLLAPREGSKDLGAGVGPDAVLYGVGRDW